MANAANHGVPMADGMVYPTAAAAIHPPVQNPMATGQAFAVNNNPAEMQHRAMVMNSMQCMPVGPIAAGMHPFAAPWHASGSRSSVSDPLVSYSCGIPWVAKVYSSSDGARKHARNHHPEWLKQVETSKRAVDAYCIRSEGVPRPVATRPPTMAMVYRQQQELANQQAALQQQQQQQQHAYAMQQQQQQAAVQQQQQQAAAPAVVTQTTSAVMPGAPAPAPVPVVAAQPLPGLAPNLAFAQARPYDPLACSGHFDRTSLAFTAATVVTPGAHPGAQQAARAAAAAQQAAQHAQWAAHLVRSTNASTPPPSSSPLAPQQTSRGYNSIPHQVVPQPPPPPPQQQVVAAVPLASCSLHTHAAAQQLAAAAAMQQLHHQQQQSHPAQQNVAPSAGLLSTKARRHRRVEQRHDGTTHDAARRCRRVGWCGGRLERERRADEPLWRVL